MLASLLRRRNTGLIAILLLAGALRVGYALGGVSLDAFYQVDGLEYADISRNLYEGRGFSISFYRDWEPQSPGPGGLHEDVYRPVLLPLLGASLHVLPGPWEFWARLCQAVLGVGLVLLAYALAAGVFGRTAGLFAAALMAVHPSAIYYSGCWLTENLFAVTMLLTMLCTWRFLRAGQ